MSRAKLRLVAKLALALRDHDNNPGKDRIQRALRAFRQACEAPYLDERLHEFVRCAEGFANPPFGQSAVHFAARLSRLCAGRSRHDLKQLYAIRSGIEHLHGLESRLPKVSKRRRFQLMLMRCAQAEALARHLLTTYLLNPALWRHFRDRSAIDAFWALPPSKLRGLWPSRLGLASVVRHFDSDEVRRRESEL